MTLVSELMYEAEYGSRNDRYAALNALADYLAERDDVLRVWDDRKNRWVDYEASIEVEAIDIPTALSQFGPVRFTGRAYFHGISREFVASLVDGEVVAYEAELKNHLSRLTLQLSRGRTSGEARGWAWYLTPKPTG